MNKKEWKEYMETKGWPKSFEVNPWGSCQYDTIHKTFKLYFKVKKDLEIVSSPRKLNADILEVFNITSNKIIPHELGYIRNAFLYNMLLETDIMLSCNDYNYTSKYISSMINITSNPISLDRMFEKSRELSWTLWKTIPAIFNRSFVELNFNTSNVPKCEGIGPALNQEVQKDNYIYGIMAALLLDFNMVKNEKCFTKFDT